MTVVDLERHRTLKLGGSEAAAACGVDPFRSRVMLWAEKTGRVERPPSEAMEWGKLLEPVVYAELERRGFEIMPAPAEGFEAAGPPWLTGHPDGFANVDGERGVLEVKTAGVWASHDWNADAGAPLSYLVQVQHYLALTDLDVALLACLIGGQKLETRVVRRDEEALARIMELEEEFVGYLRRDEPPPPDGSASAHDALLALYPEAQHKSARLDRQGWAELRELRARKEALKATERQVAELEQRIKIRIGDADTLISPHDEVVARWTQVNSKRLNTTALKAARPSIYEEFAEEKTTRRFTLE